MSTPTKLACPPESSPALAPNAAGSGFRLFLVFAVILTAIFALPLYQLVRYSLENQLWSYVLLIPWISLYLVWQKKEQIPPATSSFSLYSAIPLLLGAGVTAALVMKFGGRNLVVADYLSLTTLCFVLFLVAGAIWALGPVRARALAFPIAFLIFMVPFPTLLTHAIEFASQHASAEAASVLFAISQTPVLRDGLFFKLPGITIEVAQECSGIRSTLMLFITSLVGSYLFFRSNTHRAVLTFAVIPIAIIRNGFRIFTVAMLCVHVSPDMIHSWIHRRGGPVFFALSMIPFFLLLIFLYRRERRSRKTPGGADGGATVSSVSGGS